MKNLTLEQKLHYTLRIAIAMCFIGHGVFGIITKQIWCNYFAVFGIDTTMAYKLMPYVGTVDILFGLTMLIRPMRVIAVWLVIWGVFTAFLRPMSGEPFAEVIERAGNFGAPFAFLILHKLDFKDFKSWFAVALPDFKMDQKSLNDITNCLQIVVFLLIAGHGLLNMIEKKGLLNQYASLGFTNTALTAHIIGIIEIAAAVMVLLKPLRSFILLLLIWKMISELFYPHYELFEWVERGGSYSSILALFIVLNNKAVPSSIFNNTFFKRHRIFSY